MSAFPSLCVRSTDLTPLLAQLCDSLPSDCTYSDGLHLQTVNLNKSPSHKLFLVSYLVSMMKNIVIYNADRLVKVVSLPKFSFLSGTFPFLWKNKTK